MPHPQFINSIRAGLLYWQTRTADETEVNILRLDDDRDNLHNIMTYAQKVPDLWPDAAVVALQAFYLVERRGYWREWLPFMEQAIAKWTTADLHLQAQLWNRLGYLYQLERRLDDAVAAHEKAAALAEEVGDDLILHQACFYLCTDYRHKLDYGSSEKYGQRALTGFSKTGEINKWKAFTLNELGILAHQQGDLILARERYEAVVDLYKQMDEPVDLLRTYNNLISLAREEMNLDLALRNYDEAVVLIEHISSEFDKEKLDLNLGSIYFDLEQYAEAETIFRRANSPYLQQSSHLFQRALVLQCLGISQLRQNKLLPAEECLRESARLWRLADDEVLLGNTLGTIADLHKITGKVEAACALYHEAMDLFANHPDSAMAQRLTQKYKAYIKELEEEKR